MIDQARDVFEFSLKNMSEAQRNTISIDRLWKEINADLEAKSQARLQAENEVLMAALGAACVWITLGGMTATYLDRNSRILRQDLAARIDDGRFPGYMNIRWGRHPYATGNLNLKGLLLGWDTRYEFWHCRLNQIVDDHSGDDSWLFNWLDGLVNKLWKSGLRKRLSIMLFNLLDLCFRIGKKRLTGRLGCSGRNAVVVGVMYRWRLVMHVVRGAIKAQDIIDRGAVIHRLVLRVISIAVAKETLDRTE